MSENKFYFNNKNCSELTDRILSMINASKNYIKTGNFFFQDLKLVQALMDAASRGVAIFILTNITGGESLGMEWDVKQENNLHIPNLDKLYLKGVHVNCCTDLHAKFIIRDGEEGLIMSANYSPNCLTINPEDGVDVTDNELSDMEKLFDILYLHPDIILSDDVSKYRFLEKKNIISAQSLKEIGVNSDLRFTATAIKKNISNLAECEIHTIYDSILSIIHNSQKELYIVSWKFYRLMRLKEFIYEIKEALKRKVQIKIYYCDQAPENTVNSTTKELKALLGTKYDTIVKAFSRNHSKCVISENGGILFTANIDGDKGLLKGFELGCLLNAEQCKNAIEKINISYNNEK